MYDQICISRHFKEFKVIDLMYSNVHFLLCASGISYGFSVSMVSMINVFCTNNHLVENFSNYNSNYDL